MTDNPVSIINDSDMKFRQWLIVGICVLLNALDGFDVVSISFAAPGISTDWGINRAELGVVLSMELFGMGVGSVIIGRIADKIGRRPTAIACLVIMTTGMYAASVAHDMADLSIYRFYTGLGIGGMLATASAIVAEFSNKKNRSLAITLMGCGFTTGAIIGGSIATEILDGGSWRGVFVFGAIATAAVIPLVLVCIPESVSFLAARPNHETLARINHSLSRIGFSALSSSAKIEYQEKTKNRWQDLLSPELRMTTLLLTAAFFMNSSTSYFVLKWIPKIVADMGYSPSLAGSVLVWASVGGLAGALSLSFLTLRFQVISLVIISLFASTIFVTIFGFGQADLLQLKMMAALTVFCTGAAAVGFFAVLANAFPPSLRAGGTGFAIGFGRAGSAFGPVLGGILFNIGLGLPLVAFAMGLGSSIAAILLAIYNAKILKSPA